MNTIITQKKKNQLFLTIFISTLLIDQAIKFLSLKYLKDLGEVSFLNGFAKLIYATNKGAWGSLGSTWPEPLKKMFIIIIPLLVMGWVLYYIITKKDISKHELIAYSLIAGGGIGNLIDRIIHSEVIDMFWFGFRGYRFLQTNIFNAADVFIMLAFFILVSAEISKYFKKVT